MKNGSNGNGTKAKADKEPKTRVTSIDIRDIRLRGGRLNLSARGLSLRDRDKGESAIRWLLETNEIAIIERVKRRALHITQVIAAYKQNDVDGLRAKVTTLDISLGACVARHMDSIRGETTRINTVKSHTTLTTHLLERFGAATLLPSIGIQECKSFLNEEKHNPRWTNRHIHGPKVWGNSRKHSACMLYGRIWNDTIALEADEARRHNVRARFDFNPWKHDNVQTEKDKGGRVAFLQVAEWKMLAKIMEGQPNLVILALGCLAGLRSAEIIHLRTDVDVDMENRLLRIQEREGAYPWKPKTDNSTRNVPMSVELFNIIAEHIRKQFAGERYLVRHENEDREKPIHYEQLRNRTEEAMKEAGIKYGAREGDGITMHSLRHTYASWFVQADVQLLKIAKLMGDSVAVIEKTYAHLLPDDLAETVSIQDLIIGSGSTKRRNWARIGKE